MSPAPTSPPVAALLNHVRYDLFDVPDAATSADEARDAALAAPRDEGGRLWTGPAAEIEVQLFGKPLTIVLDPDDLPQQLARLYAIGGWPAVERTAAVARAGRDGVRMTEDIARWTQAEIDRSAAEYMLAIDVIDALERIEARAIAVALEGVRKAQQLALRERDEHYGVETAGGEVRHTLPTPVWVQFYRVTKDRAGLKEEVERLHAREAEADRLRALYFNVDDPGGGFAQGVGEKLARAEQGVALAYAEVAGGAHPFAVALAPAIPRGLVEDKLDTVLGALLQLVVTQARAVAEIPAATPDVFRSSAGWPETLLVTGPERALAERLTTQTDSLAPIVMEGILLRVLAELRDGPEPFTYFVLMHHLDTLLSVRGEQAATAHLSAALKAIATMLDLALSIAAIVDPRLRGAASVLGGALTIHSSFHALRSAMELEQSFAAAVGRDLAQGGDAEALADLGRLLTAAPQPDTVLFEILRAAVPLATLGAALARLGPQTIARLEATDMALSVL